jgi:AraC-like DNA-binding protein
MFGATSGQIEIYKQLSNCDSRTLLMKGQQIVNIPSKRDSAMVCITIVANRYDPNGTKEEKEMSATGYIGLWYMYFFCYFDYAKASDCLLQAEHIFKSINMEYPRLYLNYGVMYQSLSDQGNDTKLKQTALNYYSRAFYAACRKKEFSIIHTAFANIVTVAYDTYQLKKITNLWKTYKSITRNKHDFETVYGLLMYKAIWQLRFGKASESIRLLKEQEKIIPRSPAYIRFMHLNKINMAEAYMKSSNPESAINVLNSAIHTCERYNIKDLELEAYKEISKYYFSRGDKNNGNAFYYKYLTLKDTLLNYKQLAGMSNLRFLSKIDSINEKLKIEKHDKIVERIITAIVAVAALIITILLIIVSNKNKKLNQRNEYLYQRNVEVLKAYQEEKEKLLSVISYKQTEPAQQSQKIKQNGRYKNSTLDDNQKDSIINNIKKVMETSEEIYSSDFSIRRLAELADSNQTYVSQVINEIFDSNFNTFVNRYRIREVCQRINDDARFRKLTLEAIGNSVGFKSRSTFLVSFKRFTGIAPSDYVQLAKEKSNKNGD